MSNSKGGFEGIVGELHSLARKKPLKDRNLARCRELMVKLREMGFANKEISTLTDGGWTEPTVKLNTRGAVVKDSNAKGNAVELLSQMVNMSLSLEEVKKSLPMKAELNAKGVSFEDILSLLEDAGRSSVGVKELVQTHVGLRDSGLTFTRLAEVLSYKTRLEAAGFTIDSLGKIYKASETFGGYDGVLETITAYGQLKTLESKVEGLRSEEKRVEDQLKERRSEVEELENKRTETNGALRLYGELRSKGFDEASLEELKKSSDKYGGVKEVLEAFNTYSNLSKLETEVEKLERKRAIAESEKKRVEADNAHLQTVMNMCETLLFKKRFSVSVITGIYAVAKRYGEPLEVMKALDEYGELKALDAEVETLSGRKGELESRVKVLEGRLQDLKGQIEDLKNAITSVMEPLSSEISKSVESIRGEFDKGLKSITATYQEQLGILKNKCEEYAEKFGELKAEAGKLEEELRLARIVETIIKYPSAAVNLPFDYAPHLHRAVIELCSAHRVNPKLKAGDVMSRKYTGGIISFAEVELLDLLNWAERGLKVGLRGVDDES